MNTNYIWFLICSLAVILLPELAVAVPPIPTPAPESELAVKLCELRQLFCGDAGGGVLVAISIIFIGILVLNGKMHWTIVVLIMAGITIFLNAEYIPERLTDQDVEINEECECY